MTRLVGRSVAIVAVILAAGLAYAQTRPAVIPDISEIKKLLESPTPRDHAWGAWRAAQARAMELAPQLRQVATAHKDASVWQDSLATRAALDALIQLGGAQPAAWARTFF